MYGTGNAKVRACGALVPSVYGRPGDGSRGADRRWSLSRLGSSLRSIVHRRVSTRISRLAYPRAYTAVVPSQRYRCRYEYRTREWPTIVWALIVRQRPALIPEQRPSTLPPRWSARRRPIDRRSVVADKRTPPPRRCDSLAFSPTLHYTDLRCRATHGLPKCRSEPGEVPKRPTGADCKSAGVCLRGFESLPHHHRFSQ